MKKVALASTLALVIGGSCPATVPAKAAVVSRGSQDAKNKEILDYMSRHPGDLVGLDELTRRYTGKGVMVRFSDTAGILNATQAESHIKKFKSAPVASALEGSGSASVGGAAGMSGLKPDTFQVAIQMTPLMGPPSQVRITGGWNFKDSFAGQAAPTDIASLSFEMPSCMRMVGHSSRTYSVRGVSTNLAYLKAANVGSKAPIWAVADRSRAFEDLADHGVVGVTIQKFCNGKVTVGADFVYEFNQGGAINSISASYGVLNVSYSGQSLPPMQKGATPIYVDF